LSGIIGGFIHYLHYQLRKGVLLYAQPGTIASAASMTADSGLNALVRPGFTGQQLREALRGRKFTVDNTGRVILQGERGFEAATATATAGTAEGIDRRASVYETIMRAAR
jgi:hypothetical protein